MLFRLHYLHNVNVYQCSTKSALTYSFKQADESITPRRDARRPDRTKMGCW